MTENFIANKSILEWNKNNYNKKGKVFLKTLSFLQLAFILLSVLTAYKQGLSALFVAFLLCAANMQIIGEGFKRKRLEQKIMKLLNENDIKEA